MRAAPGALALACVIVVTGCTNLPGKPKPGPEVPRPETVLDAHRLYSQHCAGCHGVQGVYGPAPAIGSPLYQALVDDAALVRVIREGRKGGMMPGFSKRAGGDLTDQQIDALVKGIRAEWRKGNPLAGEQVPPYADDGKGSARAGEQVYASVCASCHGEAGGTIGPAGSILDPAVITLMSPQALRTTVIIGRPDLGMPDWRKQADQPLTPQQVSDVVAFLVAQKPDMNLPPEPATTTQKKQGHAHQQEMSGGIR